MVGTTSTSYENAANLPDIFFENIIRQYEGTRLGRQELLAEMLEDVPGALWDAGADPSCRPLKTTARSMRILS